MPIMSNGSVIALIVAGAIWLPGKWKYLAYAGAAYVAYETFVRYQDKNKITGPVG